MACLFGITVISAMGLNVLTGYAGLISLGPCRVHGGRERTAWPGSAPASGCRSTCACRWPGCWPPAPASPTGLPSLRIKGLYLAIATLAAQFILTFVFNAWEPVTGGRGGATVAPPEIAGLKLGTEREMYYPIAAGAVATLLFARNLFRTRVGRAFIALRDRDSAAEVMGVDPRRFQLAAFGRQLVFSPASPAASWPISTRW